jgi:hypothetical protein
MPLHTNTNHSHWYLSCPNASRRTLKYGSMRNKGVRIHCRTRICKAAYKPRLLGAAMFRASRRLEACNPFNHVRWSSRFRGRRYSSYVFHAQSSACMPMRTLENPTTMSAEKKTYPIRKNCMQTALVIKCFQQRSHRQVGLNREWATACKVCVISLQLTASRLRQRCLHP